MSTKNLDMTISENIVRMRRLKNLSQKELGERLGITQQSVSCYETCASSMTIRTLGKIAEALGCSVQSLCVDSRSVKESIQQVLDIRCKVQENSEKLAVESKQYQGAIEAQGALKELQFLSEYFNS